MLVIEIRDQRSENREQRTENTPQIQGILSAFSDCFQFAADVLMHALMPGVVLRMTGPAPFQIDS